MNKGLNEQDIPGCLLLSQALAQSAAGSGCGIDSPGSGTIYGPDRTPDRATPAAFSNPPHRLPARHKIHL